MGEEGRGEKVTRGEGEDGGSSSFAIGRKRKVGGYDSDAVSDGPSGCLSQEKRALHQQTARQ